jgi:hypothetical protein
MRMHWIVLEISILLFGLIRRNKSIPTPSMVDDLLLIWLLCLIVFSLRWSWLNHSLSADIMDANIRCYVAAIIWRTQFSYQKKEEEVIFMHVGSKHYILCSP